MEEDSRGRDDGDERAVVLLRVEVLPPVTLASQNGGTRLSKAGIILNRSLTVGPTDGPAGVPGLGAVYLSLSLSPANMTGVPPRGMVRLETGKPSPRVPLAVRRGPRYRKQCRLAAVPPPGPSTGILAIRTPAVPAVPA